MHWGMGDKMEKKAVSKEISSIFSLLKENTKECALKDIFPGVPGYYKEEEWEAVHPEGEQPLYHCLSDLTLCDLELPGEPSENGIIFYGELKKLPDFLQESACYKEIAGIRRILCHITQDEYGEIVFAGIYQDLQDISIQISSLGFALESLRFFSGTTKETRFLPGFTYDCFLLSHQTKNRMTVNQILGNGHYSVYGVFPSCEEYTAEQIFSMFQVKDIEIGDYLPEGFARSVFDHLKLKEVFIDATEESVQAFTACLASDHALTVASGKITFTPSIHFSVNQSLASSVFMFYACGEFRIGGSLYEVYVDPGRMEIGLGLKEGSLLDFSAVSELFLKTELPELTFDRLSARMGFGSGRYAFELGASDVLQFDIGQKKMAIEKIFLQVTYGSGSFSVSLTGSFSICSVGFEVSGSYLGGGNYRFACCITENINMHLSDLFHDFFGSSCLLSESFDFVISSLVFDCGLEENPSFRFAISAGFSGSDKTLKKLFSFMTSVKAVSVRQEGGWRHSIDIACMLEIGESQDVSCVYRYDSGSVEHKSMISMSYQPKRPGDTVTFEDLLHAVGFMDIEESWHFITQIGLSHAGLTYDFGKKRLTGSVRASSGGEIEISIDFGERTEYRIAVSLGIDLSFARLPVAGGLAGQFSVKKEDFGVKDIGVYILTSPDESKEMPAGVRMEFAVFGNRQQWQIYEPGEKALLQQGDVVSVGEGFLPAKGDWVLTSNHASPKVFWLKIEKSLAIFSLHRIGVGIEGSRLIFRMDTSLNVHPLRFDLFGAGIGVSMTDFSIRFSISGFGISYTGKGLGINGALMRNGDTYSGLLTIQTKPFSLSVAAEYKKDGYLFAYGIISADIGGPPAFFVKGLALGFGYNKRLVMPDIESVADYPLIKAAAGKINEDGMLAELQQYIQDESGQRFLVFGIKFSTFEIALSDVLLSVSFGNNVEIGVLGISGITMPPACSGEKKVMPLAYAQLALKAQVKPEEGFLGIEARLTSESYILSKDCHLTGGFAFFMWFGGIHAGDFVISLGGYHPKYEKNKPGHYPDVPRVGFHWNIGDSVNITGEAYFALTPSTVMAGGRLSMTYTLGNLKAYFIAKADFLIGWKPFCYDIEIGITLGASYRLKLWSISKTITVELGTDLHIWGPDFSAVAVIKIWVLSFKITIGANASKEAGELDWQKFCESFLPAGDGKERQLGQREAGTAETEPLKIVLAGGLNGKITVGKEEFYTVSKNGVTISAETAVPVTDACLNGEKIEFTPAAVRVKPMGGKGDRLETGFTVTVTDEGGGKAAFHGSVIRRNLPSALWGGEGELVRDVPCGMEVCSPEPEITIFPEKNDISLEDLYRKGTKRIADAFIYMELPVCPDYTDKETIAVFARTVNSPGVQKKRREFLEGLGVELTQEISLAKYAAEADDYFDEEVVIPVYG